MGTPLRDLSWASSSPCSRASWTGYASQILSGQTEDSMILLESKDLSPLLSISFLPLTFWPWEEFDIYSESSRGN